MKGNNMSDSLSNLESVLVLGSGKLDLQQVNQLSKQYTHVVFVDQSYTETTSITEIERRFIKNQPTISFYNGDIFTFLDMFKFMFDTVIAERIFEHMFYDSGEIGRLLDACNQITNDDGRLVIVVPNANEIAKMILYLETNVRSMEFSDISKYLLIINTEMQNTRQDPHGSCWSPQLARLYIESEGGTWEIESIEMPYTHKGRSVYMRICCRKPS